MNNDDNKLAHALRMKFGLSPYEPTQEQLNKIKNEINSVEKPTTQDWLRIVSKYCPSTGTYKYAGVDNSDLNVLLSLASNKVK